MHEHRECTTWGPRSGSCGHTHESPYDAEKCRSEYAQGRADEAPRTLRPLAADYSDREVRAGTEHRHGVVGVAISDEDQADLNELAL